MMIVPAQSQNVSPITLANTDSVQTVYTGQRSALADHTTTVQSEYSTAVHTATPEGTLSQGIL